MAGNRTTSGAVSMRYAAALIEIAMDSKAMEAVERDLYDLGAMIAQSTDLQAVIRSPVFDREEQKRGMLAIGDRAQFHQVTKNFLALLADNRRLAMILDITEAVRRDLSRRRGEVTAQVQSAQALTPEQTRALQSSLAKAMGQNVTLNVSVNRDLIGGLVVTVGSYMVDDSVKRKLERLKLAMQSQSNQNMKREEKVS